MKTNDVGSSVFLTGFILLANLSFGDVLEYAVKAAIGGAIWLGYKVLEERINKRKKDAQ